MIRLTGVAALGLDQLLRGLLHLVGEVQQRLLALRGCGAFPFRKRPLGSGIRVVDVRFVGHRCRSVLLAAGDTFRAAAREQLEVWAERNQVPIIAQQGGAEPAAVIFDGLQAARARGIDVLIADTAGRLHTQTHLMDELKKVKRVLQRLDPGAPHEVLLVLDGTIGQNAVAQAEEFNKGLGVTGLVVTKLDGTAKGGVVLAIAQKLKIPIRFVGVGEDTEDFGVFNASDFVSALLKSDPDGA